MPEPYENLRKRMSPEARKRAEQKAKEMLQHMETRMFRIRDKATGLFSRGGSRPRFDARGKIWRGLGPLKNHLNLARYRDNCEVVEYEIVETEVSTISLHDAQHEIAEKRREKAREQEERRKRAEIERLERRLVELRKSDAGS